MRVRANWQNSAIDPCASFSYGETEDYSVIIMDIPQIVLDDVMDIELFTGSTLQFTFLAESLTPGEYSWYFNNEIIEGRDSSTLIISGLTPNNAGYYQCVYSNGCGGVESNIALLQILEDAIHQLTVPQGWSGISSYLNPYNPDMPTLLEPIAGDIIILQDNVGVYWPAQNVNTIGNWNMPNGYIIKMGNEAGLEITGFLEYPKQALIIPTGWSILPINSRCTINIEEFFGQSTSLIIIKEVAGWHMYWPEMGINTLETLVPGKAYFILMESEGEVAFPECD